MPVPVPMQGLPQTPRYPFLCFGLCSSIVTCDRHAALLCVLIDFHDAGPGHIQKCTCTMNECVQTCTGATYVICDAPAHLSVGVWKHIHGQGRGLKNAWHAKAGKLQLRRYQIQGATAVAHHACTCMLEHQALIERVSVYLCAHKHTHIHTHTNISCCKRLT